MEVTQTPSATGAAPAAAESLSPIARTIAIFTNPGGAWSGLQTKTQWWFPFLLILVWSAVATCVLYERAVVPMNTEQYDRLVENGRLTAEQATKMEEGMHGVKGMSMGIAFQSIFVGLAFLVIGAGVSFGVSFMLGKKLSFRQAFEVGLWGNLIMLPASVLNGVLAWQRETLRGIHLGPGILVPVSDPPEKWQVALGSLLDAFGPFELWTVAVIVIGASTLSGASRKSTMWVIGGLYILVRVLMACLAFVFTPGA